MIDDVIFCFCTSLNVPNTIKCSIINKQFNKISKHEILWKSLFVCNFYNVNCNINYHKTYKSYHILNKFLLRNGSYNVNSVTNLKTLHMRQNELQTIPSEIGQLINLQTLNLYNNRLQTIPLEIGQLIYLDTLY